MKFEKTNLRIKIQLKIVGGVKISKKLPKMWDLWTKSCGIFSTEGGGGDKIVGFSVPYIIFQK